MDSGSVPQMTSARRPPECLSAAMRALSWPVVARNTVTFTLGKPAITADTVPCVTEVYKVSRGGGAVPAVEEEDPQAARAAASRSGTVGTRAR
jgi:hypothetical protein